MKDNSTAALVMLLVWCPHHKYNVLEVFSVADVFNQQSVRPCYLAELLNDVTSHTYQIYVEDMLRAQAGADLRVLLMRRVEAVTPGGGFTQLLLCATARTGRDDHMLYMLAPPDKKPLYAVDEELKGRWAPTWEAVFPRPPTQVWKRPYKRIACLYKIYSSQMLAIVWKTGDDQPSIEAPKHTDPRQAQAQRDKPAAVAGKAGNKQVDDRSCGGLGRSSDKAGGKQAADDPAPNNSQSDVLVFQGSQARNPFINVLRWLSAVTVEHRAPIINDPGLCREVLEHPEVNDPSGESVLAASVALADRRISMLDWGGKGPKEPHLFVLTLSKVVVFNISLGAWFPQQCSQQLEMDMEDFRPKDLYMDAAENGAGEATKVPQTECWKALKKTSVLQYSSRCVLPPQEVVFRNSAEADLMITGKHDNVIDIRFYDDTEREHWRRALAYILFKTTQKVWTREIPVST